MRGVVKQRQPQAWHEAHFLELGFSTNGFSHWAGGDPLQAGAFRADDQSHRFNHWGAVLEGRDAIAMFHAGPVAVYDGRGYGRYERLDCSALPALYLAYQPALGKVSGKVLNEIRRNYDRGDAHTIATLKAIASLADEGREALARGDRDAFARLLDRNFDLRREIMTISPPNLEMIRTARELGATASFAGSGGSIIGTFDGEEMLGRLTAALERLGATVVRPIVQ